MGMLRSPTKRTLQKTGYLRLYLRLYLHSSVRLCQSAAVGYNWVLLAAAAGCCRLLVRVLQASHEMTNEVTKLNRAQDNDNSVSSPLRAPGLPLKGGLACVDLDSQGSS